MSVSVPPESRLGQLCCRIWTASVGSRELARGQVYWALASTDKPPKPSLRAAPWDFASARSSRTSRPEREAEHLCLAQRQPAAAARLMPASPQELASAAGLAAVSASAALWAVCRGACARATTAGTRAASLAAITLFAAAAVASGLALVRLAVARETAALAAWLELGAALAAVLVPSISLDNGHVSIEGAPAATAAPHAQPRPVPLLDAIGDAREPPCGHPPPCPRPRIPSPFGPFRGWDSAYNSSALDNESYVNASWMYPEGTCNFMPNSHYLLPYPRDTYTTLAWSFCWESPYVSKANGSVLNATSVAAYFEEMATPDYADGLAGKGLDECNLGNAAVKGEREAAAVGFRNARKKNPDMFLAAWGGQDGDTIYASLMKDWTFSLAMIEGYSYCAGCGDWPASGHCCATTGVSAYYPRLDFARAHGYLNRTVFCFGYMIGRSVLNPRGWTHDSLKAEMVKLKSLYPELAGVLMYGGGAKGAVFVG
eukprot:SAG22_NODE_565_length_9046_cov_142.250475_2_plen_486_part_00